MSDADKNFEALITLVKETNEAVKTTQADAANTKEYIHALKNEMQGINGQLLVMREAQEFQKENNKEQFQRVHSRIDKEVDNIKVLSDTLNEIAPKAKSVATVFDWATKAIVTAMIAGILYASSLYLTK